MSTPPHDHTVLKAVFYGGLQRATVIIFGMLTTMVLAHWAVTPHQMGIWSLYLIVAAFVEIVRHGLVKNSVIKYLNTSTAAERPFVLGASLVLNILITLAVAAVIFFCTPLLVRVLKAPELRPMLYWNNLALLSLIPFSHFEWLMLSQLNLKHLFWTYVVRQSVTLLLLLVPLVLGQQVSLNALVIYYAAGILSGALVAYFFYRHRSAHLAVPPRAWLLRLFHFGKYAFGTNMSNLVMRSTDSFVVSNLLTTAIVAQQGIALRIFNMVDIPSQLIGDILFPKTAHLSAQDKGHVKFYFEKSSGAVLAVVLPLALVVFLLAEWTIWLLAGTQYLNAAPYLRCMMLASIVLCFLKQYGTITDAIGRPRTNFLVTTGMAVVNVGLCFFWVSRFGLIGAAYSFIITSLLAFAITQHLLWREFGVNVFNSLRYAAGFYPQMGKLVQQKLFSHA